LNQVILLPRKDTVNKMNEGGHAQTQTMNSDKNDVLHPPKVLSETVLKNCFLGFDCPTIDLQVY